VSKVLKRGRPSGQPETVFVDLPLEKHQISTIMQLIFIERAVYNILALDNFTFENS